MLTGHHGVCGERGGGRETDRLGIEQTSVAMSRHVAGDTDGRNSAGRRSFDCLQSPPRPSLAHRRRTRLGAAARRTVRVSQSCWGFRGLLDAGRESVPHLRRRPTPSRGSGRRNLNPDRTPSQHRPPPPPLSLLSRPVEDCEGCPPLAGARNLGLDDPRAVRPDSHCNFGDRSIRACRATAATQRKSRKRAVPAPRHCSAPTSRPGQSR